MILNQISLPLFFVRIFNEEKNKTGRFFIIEHMG
jgi:hypothetical protein